MPSWAMLGRSWPHLGPFWGLLGVIFGVLVFWHGTKARSNNDMDTFSSIWPYRTTRVPDVFGHGGEVFYMVFPYSYAVSGLDPADLGPGVWCGLLGVIFGFLWLLTWCQSKIT